jgi:hypothetical protein
VFQNCNIGAYVNIVSDTLHLTNVSECNVVTPVSDCYDCGSVSGSVTANCGTATSLALVDASRWSGFEGEPTITVNPANPLNLFLAAMHTTNDDNFPILFTATSSNGGTNWTALALTNANDVSDVSAASDAFGNLFFCHPPSNGAESGVVVLLSTNLGSSFNTLTNFSGLPYSLDQPKLTTGPSGSSGTSSVWITYCDKETTNIVARGAAVTGFGQVGAWTPPAYVLNSTQYNWGSIAIGPTGQVALVFQHVTRTNESGATQIRMSVNPGGLGGTFATAWDVLNSNMGCLQLPPAAPHDGIDVSPCLAWDRTGGQYRGRLYMAYTDRPQTPTNNMSIYVVYSTNNGAAGSWSNPLKVNDDTTANSHFYSRIAVDQTSGNVAVSWYDCRNDPNNVQTQFYAAVSSNGGQTFSSNLWIETGGQSDALITTWTDLDYLDYTGLAYYGGYFYPAWTDNSNDLGAGSNPDGTKERDIYVAKVQY